MIPSNKRNWAASLTKKVLVALFVTLIFALISWVPPIGYTSEARIYAYKRYAQYGYAIVDFGCNMSFNPFLYPLAWAFGRGYLSGNFSMYYLPQTYGGSTGEASGGLVWGKPDLVRSEAVMKVVLDEFFVNIPVLAALFFAVELVGSRRVYLWFLGGGVGFVFSFPFGVLAGLLVAVFSTFVILPKLRKTVFNREPALKS